MPLIEDLGRSTTTGSGRFYSYARVGSSTNASGNGNSGPGGNGGTGGRTKRISAYQPRASDNATRQRAVARRLADLEKENYNDQYQRFEIPNIDALIDTSLQTSMLGGGGGGGKNRRRSVKTQTSKSGSTPSTRKILASRKTLMNLQDDDPVSARDVQNVLSVPPRYPVKHLCSICGGGGKYLCSRCGLRYCSLSCDDTHKETRCIKMYA